MTTNSMNTHILRLLLVVFLVLMYTLAVFYLFRRRMSPWAYALWGVFALVIPVLGPFLVILIRPGLPARAPGQVRKVSPS